MSTGAEVKAQILIADITDALSRGTKHFDVSGRPLLTVRAILEALQRDGKVELAPCEVES